VEESHEVAVPELLLDLSFTSKKIARFWVDGFMRDLGGYASPILLVPSLKDDPETSSPQSFPQKVSTEELLAETNRLATRTKRKRSSFAPVWSKLAPRQRLLRDNAVLVECAQSFCEGNRGF